MPMLVRSTTSHFKTPTHLRKEAHGNLMRCRACRLIIVGRSMCRPARLDVSAAWAGHQADAELEELRLALSHLV